MKRWYLLSVGCLSLLTLLSVGWAEDEKGQKEDSDRPIVKPREEVRKGDNEKPREGERKADGEKGREEVRKDGDKPREGERKADGDKGRSEVRKDGDKPREGDKPKAGDRKPEGDRPKEVDKPKEGSGKKNPEADKPREKSPEAREGKPHPEAQAFERRMQELHMQLKKHAEAGREEDVARLKREIGELQKGHRPEVGERGEHLKIAVQRMFEASEHLRAAGLVDAAEGLSRHAKEIMQHAHRGPGEARGPEHRPERREEHDDRLQDIGAALKKLNERLERLESERGNK